MLVSVPINWPAASVETGMGVGPKKGALQANANMIVINSLRASFRRIAVSPEVKAIAELTS
jgi:hypothetical protein